MGRSAGLQNPRPDLLALEVHVTSAGLALACPFSSSDEFDAALIAERRAAGVYGPKRHRRQMLVSATAVIAALVVIAFFAL